MRLDIDWIAETAKRLGPSQPRNIEAGAERLLEIAERIEHTPGAPELVELAEVAAQLGEHHLDPAEIAEDLRRLAAIYRARAARGGAPDA